MCALSMCTCWSLVTQARAAPTLPRLRAHSSISALLGRVNSVLGSCPHRRRLAPQSSGFCDSSWPLYAGGTGTGEASLAYVAPPPWSVQHETVPVFQGLGFLLLLPLPAACKASSVPLGKAGESAPSPRPSLSPLPSHPLCDSG